MILVALIGMVIGAGAVFLFIGYMIVRNKDESVGGSEEDDYYDYEE